MYKSNEPGQLDAGRRDVRLFDPADDGIPGTFGVIYTTPSFLDEHPTAVQDFVRAAFKGYADAVADPAARRGHLGERDQRRRQPELPDRGGRDLPMAAGVGHRGQGHAGGPIGLIDPGVFAAEVDAYTKAGIFPNGAPVDRRHLRRGGRGRAVRLERQPHLADELSRCWVRVLAHHGRHPRATRSAARPVGPAGRRRRISPARSGAGSRGRPSSRRGGR